MWRGLARSICQLLDHPVLQALWGLQGARDPLDQRDLVVSVQQARLEQARQAQQAIQGQLALQDQRAARVLRVQRARPRPRR